MSVKIPKDDFLREQLLNETFKAIVANCPNGYAKTYAQTALNHRMTKKCMEIFLFGQIPYVLSNMKEWEGEEAEKVREILEAVQEELKGG